MNRYIPSVLILLTLTTTAKSQTTEDLERHCKFFDVIDTNKANSFLSTEEFSDAQAKSLHCAGYIEGFLRAFAAFQLFSPSNMPFCLPEDGIGIDQASGLSGLRVGFWCCVILLSSVGGAIDVRRNGEDVFGRIDGAGDFRRCRGVAVRSID